MVGVRPGVCVTDSRGFLPRSACPPRAAASRTYVAVESGSARLVAITRGRHPVAVVYVLVRLWPLSRRTSVRELTADTTPGM